MTVVVGWMSSFVNYCFALYDEVSNRADMAVLGNASVASVLAVPSPGASGSSLTWDSYHHFIWTIGLARN
jgi:hypothetical protein